MAGTACHQPATTGRPPWAHQRGHCSADATWLDLAWLATIATTRVEDLMTQESAGMVSRADVLARGPVPLARAVLVDADEVWRVGLRLLLRRRVWSG